MSFVIENNIVIPEAPKKKRGRPKGSTNRPKETPIPQLDTKKIEEGVIKQLSLLGRCKLCGKGISIASELYGVDKWKSILVSAPNSTQQVHKLVPDPNFIYCFDCYGQSERPKKRIYR